MAKRIEKANLPTKICPACGRPFAWRRKWAKVWDEVRYCSAGCRKGAGRDGAARPPVDAADG